MAKKYLRFRDLVERQIVTNRVTLARWIKLHGSGSTDSVSNRASRAIPSLRQPILGSSASHWQRQHETAQAFVLSGHLLCREKATWPVIPHAACENEST